MEKFKKVFSCLSVSAGVLFGSVSVLDNCQAITSDQTQILIRAIREDIRFSNYFSGAKEVSKSIEDKKAAICYCNKYLNPMLSDLSAKFDELNKLTLINGRLSKINIVDTDNMAKELDELSRKSNDIQKEFTQKIIEFILNSDIVDPEDRDKLASIRHEEKPFDVLAQIDNSWKEFAEFMNKDLAKQWSYFEID